MTKKILFTGYYGFNNFGDDLFGWACVYGLKSSGCDYLPIILSPPINDIEANCLVPKFFSNIYKDTGFKGKLLRLLFMVYGCVKYREVVLAGGSVISSGSSRHMRLLQYYLVKYGVCDLSAIGISVGPFHSEWDRNQARKLINRLKYLCVRDESSARECKGLGINNKFYLYNDLAGCVPSPSFAENKKKQCIVGVSICRYESIVGGNLNSEVIRNRAIFQGISDFAIKYNFKVKILILNSNEIVGDIEVSRKLFDFVCENNISAELIDYVSTVESLTHISSCSLFFSVRLHGAISAYLLEIPFVLVEYHQKCTDFLDYIGFDKQNRLIGGIKHKTEVTISLEKIFQEGKKYVVKPEEYREISNKIFRKSPWVI